MLEKIASISVIVILICMLFLNPKVSIIKNPHKTAFGF